MPIVHAEADSLSACVCVTSCITNLLNYRAVRTRARLPRGPSAAVLVPLFVGRSGDLYVVLSRCVVCSSSRICVLAFVNEIGVLIRRGPLVNRRSDALKTFAGDTALPGGKIDAQDVTVEDTAVSCARLETFFLVPLTSV